MMVLPSNDGADVDTREIEDYLACFPKWERQTKALLVSPVHLMFRLVAPSKFRPLSQPYTDSTRFSCSQAPRRGTESDVKMQEIQYLRGNSQPSHVRNEMHQIQPFYSVISQGVWDEHNLASLRSAE